MLPTKYSSRVDVDLTDIPSDTPDDTDIISIASGSDVQATRPKRPKSSIKTAEPPHKKTRTDNFSERNPYALNELSDSENGDGDIVTQAADDKGPSSIKDFVKHYRAILGQEEFDEMVRRGRLDAKSMCALSEKTRAIYTYPGVTNAQKMLLEEYDASFEFSSAQKRIIRSKKHPVEETKSKLLSLHVCASKEIAKLHVIISSIQSTGINDPATRRDVRNKMSQVEEKKSEIRHIIRHLTAGIKTKEQRELNGDHRIIVVASTPAAVEDYRGNPKSLEEAGIAVGKLFGEMILRSRTDVEFVLLYGLEQRHGLPEGLPSKFQDGFPNDNYEAEKKVRRFLRDAKESGSNSTILLLGERQWAQD